MEKVYVIVYVVANQAFDIMCPVYKVSAGYICVMHSSIHTLLILFSREYQISGS